MTLPRPLTGLPSHLVGLRAVSSYLNGTARVTRSCSDRAGVAVAELLLNDPGGWLNTTAVRTSRAPPTPAIFNTDMVRFLLQVARRDCLEMHPPWVHPRGSRLVLSIRQDSPLVVSRGFGEGGRSPP